MALFLFLSPSPRLQEPLPDPLVIEGPLPSSPLEKTGPEKAGIDTTSPRNLSGLRKDQALVRFEISSEIKVFWDETPVASSGFIQTIPGSHQLRLEKAGSNPVQQTIDVASDVPTTISLLR